MSLATRCSSCGTVFRVVQDQLKVSEGWVRCGRCDAVFNALEGLLDLSRDTPAEWDEAAASNPGSGASAAAVAASEPLRSASADAPSPKDRSDPGPTTSPAAREDLDPIDAQLFRNRRAESDKAPPVQVNARDRLEFSDARFDSDLFAENTSAPNPELVESQITGAGDLPLESASQQPDFLRRAERRARWRGGPVRVALVTLSAFGAIALAAQIAHHFRDALAAQWPAARPA